MTLFLISTQGKPEQIIQGAIFLVTTDLAPINTSAET